MTTLQDVLEKIKQVESRMNDVHRIYVSIRREVERDQKLGRFVHPIRHLEVEGLDGRLTDICNELERLYEQRNGIQAAIVALRIMARLNNGDVPSTNRFIGPEKAIGYNGRRERTRSSQQFERSATDLYRRTKKIAGVKKGGKKGNQKSGQKRGQRAA